MSIQGPGHNSVQAGRFQIRDAKISSPSEEIRADSGADNLLSNGLPGVSVSAEVILPNGKIQQHRGWGVDSSSALAVLCSSFIDRPFSVITSEVSEHKLGFQARIFIKPQENESPLSYGSAFAKTESDALVAATIKALANGNFLKKKFQHAGHREADATTQAILQRVEEIYGQQGLDEKQRAQLHHQILNEINAFAAGVTVVTLNTPDELRLLSRFDVNRSTNDQIGLHNIKTPIWHEWYPGLDNHEQTLTEVVGAMPAVPASFIPKIVQLFENPKGWLQFRGAIDLDNHNNLHVILGRGLQDQDEAFVLGFTMGSAKNLTWLEQAAFKFVVSTLYPEPYRITKNLLPAYDLGVQAGKEMGVSRIYQFDLQKDLDKPLGELRKLLGIDTNKLREFYKREMELIPGTVASSRLPLPH